MLYENSISDSSKKLKVHYRTYVCVKKLKFFRVRKYKEGGETENC